MIKKLYPKKSKRAITVVETLPTQPIVEKTQFPNFYRLIPELSFTRFGNGIVLFFASFFTGFLMMAIVLEGYQMQGILAALQHLQMRETALERQISYWQKFTAEHPDYRDGYFKLAVLEQQIGKTTEAQLYLTKTLTLDPNFVPAQTLAAKINIQ